MGRAEILVVGASGLVGSELMRHLGGRAAGTCNRHPSPGLLACDITDADRTAKVVEAVSPRVIIHTAALTDVDYCETDPDASHAINVEGTRNVARAAAQAGARYIFVSTDYVFGGEQGPHKPHEAFAPVNVYGGHKAEAEGIVAATVDDHVILRACGLYGYQPAGKNFVQAVFECGRTGKEMRVPLDQWGSPTLASDISEAATRIADSDMRGAVHVAGPDYLTRLDLARRAADAFGLDPAFIHGVTTAELNQAAPRPLKAGLDASDTATALGMHFVGMGEGLVRMRAALEAAGYSM